MVFGTILTGRQSGQKLVFVWGSDGKKPFSKSNFTKFVNFYPKILGGGFYSPSLKDVAWLERAQLIFLIFHTFVCKFGRVEAAAREKKYRQMYEKLEKLTERLLSTVTYILQT